MKLLLIKNDLVRNKAINFVLFLFMMFSAVLAILSVIVTVQTFTSISELYKKAEPAHFIQMHKGEINPNELEQFIASYESVVDWQIVTMINVFGSSLTVVQNDESFDLSNIRFDISLVKQMGFIFQHSYLLKNLSIRDNIVLPGFKAKKFSRKRVNEKADQLMERTKIESVASHDVTTVSGGQLQRAAICRALINEPDIIFGDEPTGALNSSASNEVMNIIQEINNNGTTVIIVTHDVNVAARAERILFIMDGTIYDELKLGKYDGNKINQLDRKEKLTKWLNNHVHY